MKNLSRTNKKGKEPFSNRGLDKGIPFGLNNKQNIKKLNRTLTNQKETKKMKKTPITHKMEIIVHPEVAVFKQVGSIGEYSFKDFAKEEFYRRDILNGEEFLNLVHTERHIRKVKNACLFKDSLAELRLTPECYRIACLGVRTVILASEEGHFAIQCFTGHHAGRETAMGFNLFNSTAIATQRLVNQGKRVCIIDIDGHHGNGIQSIFYKTDQVLYCSIHQQDTFPGTGSEKETGKEEGKGYTLNIPLPKNSGDEIFLEALRKIIKRSIEFKPDIVGVFAGFDGYYADELLSLNYSLKGFYESGKIIGQNFKQVFAVLGGGYHRDLIKCIFTFVSGINQEEYPY